MDKILSVIHTLFILLPAVVDSVECSDGNPPVSPEELQVPPPQTAFTYCKSRTTGGTGSGAPCAPWFIYKGVNYTECTNADNPRPWCSMTTTYSDVWGVCSIPEDQCQPFCETFTEGGPASGAPCIFPFAYKGKIYFECTTIDHKSHWCSTTRYYNKNSWGVCAYRSACAPTTTTTTTTVATTTTTMTPGPVGSQQTNAVYCMSRTVGGTANGAPCAPTFSFKGMTFTDCTSVDNQKPWCSTTPVYTGGWGVCLSSSECHPFCSDRTDRGNGGGAPCVFPFYYKGQEYRTCTTKDHKRHWCGTSSDSYKWGNCIYAPECTGARETTLSTTMGTQSTTNVTITSTAPPDVSSTMGASRQQSTQYCTTRTIWGKGAFGAPCAIPFTYKGQTYNDCTTADNPRPWCSMTPSYSGKWGVCLTIGECTPFCTTMTERGSANGAPCVFPFSYQGVEYNACTTIGHNNRHWCATTYLYNRNSWGNCIYGTSNCKPTTTEMPITPTTSAMVTPTTQANGAYGLYCISKTYAGNSDGAPCSMPFEYNGSTYKGCITTAGSSGPWCSTTPVFSGRYGQCYLNNECAPFCPGSTQGGTANGLPCVFPFVYRGTTYYNCITRDHINTQHWCSVTPTYTSLWGNCIYASPCPVSIVTDVTPNSFCKESTIDGNAFGAPCAQAPWTFKGKAYTDCTYEENTRPWCSTTQNFEGKWGVCRIGACPNLCSGYTVKGTAKGAKCVFPFRYKGKNYTTCTTFENEGVLWCSTTSEFSGSWGRCVYDVCQYCPDRTIGGTAFGAPCASSWKYNGNTYNGCIKTDRDRFWCSTTTDYNGSWGECLEPSCKRLCRDRTDRGSAGGAPCVFPFSYKGVTYTSCTMKDHFRMWCATTSTYDKKNWGNCIYGKVIT